MLRPPRLEKEHEKSKHYKELFWQIQIKNKKSPEGLMSKTLGRALK
jgi:hypothetical protein